MSSDKNKSIMWPSEEGEKEQQKQGKNESELSMTKSEHVPLR